MDGNVHQNVRSVTGLVGFSRLEEETICLTPSVNHLGVEMLKGLNMRLETLSPLS